MNTNNKKLLILTLTLMALLSLFALFTGCGKPLLPPVKEIINTTDKTTVNTTDITEIDRNRAITDTINILIGQIRTGQKECDSVCQEAIDFYFSQLNYQKASGENKYKILYDKHTKLLTAYINLQETANKTTVIRKDSIVYRDNFKYKEVPVITNIVPWYMRYSAYAGWVLTPLFLVFAVRKIKSLIA